MLVIGEKINRTRAEVGAAIEGRDEGFIQDLARRQVEAGATYLDVNAAGTQRSQEPEDLVWLVTSVQSAVDVPLCLDSVNPEAVAAALAQVTQVPLVNSISGEQDRLRDLLPLVAAEQCPVIALAVDDTGIGRTVDARMAVVRRVLAETRAVGVADELVYVDPLVLPLAGLDQSGAVTIATIGAIREEFPEARVCLGLSNLSFGLPRRGLINRVFLTLALGAGLDAALLDPLDDQLMQEFLAAELVLGHDRHCRRYTQAYRSGSLG